MKIDILEHEVFDSVDYTVLARYLTAQSWNIQSDSLPGASIWDKQTPTGARFRVWLPQDRRFADYSESMARVIRTVAESENRSQLQVLEDLETITIGDVIRVRTVDEFSQFSGTLSLFDGIQLLNQARNMVTAAALAAIEKREVYGSRRPLQVNDYVDSVRVGQTERGSYLVKLISPVDPSKLRQLGIDNIAPDMAPFERRVVVTLLRALRSLETVATQSYQRGRYFFEPFREIVQEGVSANLCEAIAGSVDVSTTRYRPIAVNVSWSYALGMSESGDAHVSFQPDVLPFVARAAQEFRARNPEEVFLRGYVNSLRRDKKGDPNTISVLSYIDDKLRSVRMTLQEDSYTTAIRAHENDYEVSVMGVLKREGRWFTLESPVNFHIRDIE